MFSGISKPVIIMPFHFNSAVLYHALTAAEVEVLGFWDNDAALNNERYNGKCISLPLPSARLTKDVTVIVYYKKHERSIRRQLESLGYNDVISAQDFDVNFVNDYVADVLDDDIYRLRPDYRSRYCRELWMDSETRLPMTDESRDESLKTLFASHGGGRKILLVSPDIGVTGAVIALQQAARVLLKNGDLPLFFCKHKASLMPVFLDDGIPVLIDFKLPDDRWFITLAAHFEMVIVNTIMLPCIMAIDKLNFTSIPVLWWIHESNVFYTEERVSAIPNKLGGNIRVCCVGDYALKALSHYVPDIPADSLLYGVEDFFDKTQLRVRKADKKIRFMTIGSIYWRKGQDILCSAIRRMDESIRSNCDFVVVGANVMLDETYNELLLLQRDFPEAVILTGVVSREEIKLLLSTCDCMICASRSDSMPVFITEAMMFYKLVICSENTGTYSLIVDGINGFTYTGNSAELLCDKMQYVSEHFDELDDMRKRSRDIYDSYFAADVFRENLLAIIDDLTKK